MVAHSRGPEDIGRLDGPVLTFPVPHPHPDSTDAAIAPTITFADGHGANVLLLHPQLVGIDVVNGEYIAQVRLNPDEEGQVARLYRHDAHAPLPAEPTHIYDALRRDRR